MSLNFSGTAHGPHPDGLSWITGAWNFAMTCVQSEKDLTSVTKQKNKNMTKSKKLLIEYRVSVDESHWFLQQCTKSNSTGQLAQWANHH